MYTNAKRTLRAAALAISLALGSAALAQLNLTTPDELQDISITEKLDAQIPLDLEFVDDEGRPVKLADYFNGERPVILTLNYYRCPMLCGLMLNGMIDALKRISLEPGQDFEIVTVGFDPLEGPDLAAAKKRNYVNEYGRSSAVKGWHFLTGKRDPIKKLADTVGFKYKWNEAQQQWGHSASLIICTPNGRVSRYIGGVVFDPQTVRMSLIESSEGKIGTLFDQVFLTCFQYHSGDGAYTASAIGFMRLGGAITLVFLAALVLVLWRRDFRRKKKAGAQSVLTPSA